MRTKLAVDTNPLPRWPVVRGERGGGGHSVMALLLVPVIILLVGLVVDSGAQLSAIQQAEAAADGAASAGLNAAAAASIGGTPSAEFAAAQAREYLARAGVDGTVRVEAGNRLVVNTWVTRPTRYLSLIGITLVTGRADSTVILQGG